MSTRSRPGTLTTFDSQIDVTTGTIRMRATFDNPNGVLFPQQFVNVRLLVDTMTGATLAPNAAIQLGAGLKGLLSRQALELYPRTATVQRDRRTNGLELRDPSARASMGQSPVPS